MMMTFVKYGIFSRLGQFYFIQYEYSTSLLSCQ